jgi:predicted deacylase
VDSEKVTKYMDKSELLKFHPMSSLVANSRFCLLFCTIISLFSALLAKTTVHTYFPQTPHELKVYHLQGTQPGATILVIAAVHGDEAAPFLAADSFVDLSLKQGNMIIIPRANPPAIAVQRRFVNADMNRRFAQTSHTMYEDEVVSVIKKYAHMSDVLLNLHEGGGFYRHTWEGPNHNPQKYGQCLIADADSFFVEKTGKYINLKKIAEDIIEQINKQIDIPEYTYRFNNHDTMNRNTRHVVQRGSASFFGLTVANIPSYGLEVSSNLPSEKLKIEYMALLINEFMNYYGVIRYSPILTEEKPVLRFVLARINGEKRYFEANDVIALTSGSTFQITDILTNYPRGNYAHVVGLGNRNDVGKTFNITQNTEIIIYKDHLVTARLPIRVVSEVIAFEGFRVNIVDEKKSVNVLPGETLTVTDGATFEIIGPISPNPNVTFHVAGAGSSRLINTSTGLNERFAVNSEKTLYEIDINERGRSIAKSFLQIRPIVPGLLHITHNGFDVYMAPGDTLFTRYNDTLFIHEVELNGLSTDKVKVNFAGYILDPRKDAEDRGGNIYLNSRGLIPRFAVNPPVRDTYEIHVLYKTKRYATYTVVVRI